MAGKHSASKVAYWSTHVENWRVSGLSQAAYCSKNGIHVKNFRRWRIIFDQQAGPMPSPASAEAGKTAPFIPVSIMQDLEESVDLKKTGRRPDAGIQLQVGSYTVDLAVGFDAGTLKQLLTVLGGTK
jgi:hypothetical protein